MTPADVRLLARSAHEHRIHELGAPPSPWSVRPLEPYATNYQWSAMLDPYELGKGVTISDVRSGELFGRAVVAFVARAVPGYEPVCSCCPLVFSEVSQRLEYGDGWRAQPRELPDGVDMTLDLDIGIVVSHRHRGGLHGQWFTNEITRVM